MRNCARRCFAAWHERGRWFPMINRLDAFVRSILYVLVRLYQRGLSPLLGPSCRFEPSCSQYALEALQRCSAARAVWLIGSRLLRCQPLCRGGLDPVPEDPIPPGRRVLSGVFVPRWNRGEDGDRMRVKTGPRLVEARSIRGQGTPCSHG